MKNFDVSNIGIVALIVVIVAFVIGWFLPMFIYVAKEFWQNALM